MIEIKFVLLKYDLEEKSRFWNLLEPYTSQRILHRKCLTTVFSDGFGKEFFIHGLVSSFRNFVI